MSVGRDPTSDGRFADLYEREFARVFRAAYAITGNRHVAEEATQEAFARALSRWRRLGAEPWAAAWVTTTALNVSRRLSRRRPERSPSPQRESDQEALIDLRLAIAHLPARQQTALVLYHLVGLPIADVARAMGCGEGSVKTHLWRARAALARALSDDAAPSPAGAGKEIEHG